MNDLTATEEPSSLDTLTPVRIETALSRFPIHRLSKSGVLGIDLHNQAGAVHWEVSYSSKYGQPGPLAYKLDTLVVGRHIDEIGKPAPELLKLGSLSDIATELGVTIGGKSLSDIKRALHQNASAYVEAKITFRGTDGSEHWVEEGFSRYSIILTGEKLPNGRKADAVYIRLHPTYRHILNTALTRPLDYDYMKTLGPSAQRLYEIASYQIHYAIKTGAMYARIRYSTYCILAPAPRYATFEKVKKQMYKIHRPHIESGYLKEVKYEATTDDTGQLDWVLLYKPGPNADRWYREFLPGAVRAVRRPRLENDGLTLPFPELFAPALSAEFVSLSQPAPADAPSEIASDPPETLSLIVELKASDLNGADAERLAREKPDECRRQLDYLPYVTSFTSTKGAYLRRAIEQEYGRPKAYVETQSKAEEENKREAQAQAVNARRAAYEARTAAEALQAEEMFTGLKTSDPEAFEMFLAFVEDERARLTEPHKRMPEKIKARYLASLDTSEKQRELFALWQAEREGRVGQLGLRLPAEPGDVEKRHVSTATVDEIIAECDVANAARTAKQAELSAYSLLDDWLSYIRREGTKIANLDKAYTDFALRKIYGIDK